MENIARGAEVEGGKYADEETQWKRKISDITVKYMLRILTGEASKVYKKKIYETEQ